MTTLADIDDRSNIDKIVEGLRLFKGVKRVSLKNLFHILFLFCIVCSCTFQNGDNSISYNGIDRLDGISSSDNITLKHENISDNIVLFSFSAKDTLSSASVLFDSIPGFRQGMTIWRYKPWNSWTKPVPVDYPSQMEDWDVQFFYWQYDDGLYGAMVPLCHKGFRTTLGSEGNRFGAKSQAYAPNNDNEDVAQLVVGFGANPYRLFEELYEAGMSAIGESENLVRNKTYPEAFDYLGWCTYNALKEIGLSERTLTDAVKRYSSKDIKFRWILVDDGYQDHTDRRLNSFRADKKRFPNGFNSMIEKMKNEYGLRDIGVWQAFNGYWNGINPHSELGEKYAEDLFTWYMKPQPTDPDSVPVREYTFIKPGTEALINFYDSYIRFSKEEGFSFVKIDNQLMTERMAPGNYPIGYLSKQMHDALNKAVFAHMDGAIINCMDMTAEAYQYFGKTAIARAVEDYFPIEEDGIGYNMERGNAAAHLIMALYNNLYFSQMVYTDFDMFQSHNPDGAYHAIARAVNNGPIYLTDIPELTKKDVITPLSYSDGKLIRPQSALMLTEDCLFQHQKPMPIKAFSNNKSSSILTVWNMSDCDKVTGRFSPSDIDGLQGEKFVVYDYCSKQAIIAGLTDKLPIDLERMGYALYHIYPYSSTVTPIGLMDKYNCGGTIISLKSSDENIEIEVGDSGIFAAYSSKIPQIVEVNGHKTKFEYKDNLIVLEVPSTKDREVHTIRIYQ